MLTPLAAWGAPVGLTNNQQFLDLVSSSLGILLEWCKEMDAQSTLMEEIRAFRDDQSKPTFDYRESVVRARIEVIMRGVHHNLESRKFFVLSDEEAAFHANPELFGEVITKKYSIKVALEGMDAGACFAASQYTACVFHCMRVAEYGLRKLAANSMLRVKLTDKGKRMPVDYATWNKVLTAIRIKITKIRHRPHGPKREEDLQFFSNAADHCEYMKDIWRNEISHTKRRYQKDEAKAAISRVKEFVTSVGDHKGSPVDEDTIERLAEKLRKHLLPPSPSVSSLLQSTDL